MRNGRLVVTIGSVLASVLCAAAVSLATSNPVGPPIALGPRALELEMKRNPEIALLIERRGYPDWVERIEVDNVPPLDAYEIHLYYLRLNSEYAFARASILGRPEIGLRQFVHPLDPAMRARIVTWYLAASPARRAEVAAVRAEASAEQAEHLAAVSTDSADEAVHTEARAVATTRRHVGRVKHHAK
ncbi:MAG TPA: hypothetical protein VGK30_09890 [Candidatus Binatia bacterium]|jgi:hypothetical protein